MLQNKNEVTWRLKIELIYLLQLSLQLVLVKTKNINLSFN